MGSLSKNEAIVDFHSAGYKGNKTLKIKTIENFGDVIKNAEGLYEKPNSMLYFTYNLLGKGEGIWEIPYVLDVITGFVDIPETTEYIRVMNKESIIDETAVNRNWMCVYTPISEYPIDDAPYIGLIHDVEKHLQFLDGSKNIVKMGGKCKPKCMGIFLMPKDRDMMK